MHPKLQNVNNVQSSANFPIWITWDAELLRKSVDVNEWPLILNESTPSLFPLGYLMKARLTDCRCEMFLIKRSCTVQGSEIYYIYLVFFIWCQRQIDCLWVWFLVLFSIYLPSLRTHAPPFSKAEELVLPALIALVMLSFTSVMMASFLLRAVEAKAASTCGPRETEAATTTATATAMLQACGPSPSTRPSTTAARPCMTRAAPPPWPPPSATAARGTQRPEWWVLHRPKFRGTENTIPAKLVSVDLWAFSIQRTYLF